MSREELIMILASKINSDTATLEEIKLYESLLNNDSETY